MKHIITISADGSSTLKLTEFNESYHSIHGAYSEAMHIYIKNGLQYLFEHYYRDKYYNSPNSIYIYDIGLGTALNCLLAILWQYNTPNSPAIYYHGIEKYPISADEIKQLNFHNYIVKQIVEHGGPDNNIMDKIKDIFHKIHESPWEEDIELSSHFTLHKSNSDIAEFKPDSTNNLIQTQYKTAIFYDTFSPHTQPELWSKEIFTTFYNNIPTGSILLTYCSKGSVKQALRDAEFIVKRLEGANGKRHMVRAEKCSKITENA